MVMRRSNKFLLASLAAALLFAPAVSAQEHFDLAALIAKVKPSVVLIEVLEKGQRLGNGSGFVVDTKGVIATNYHVIEGAKELQVSFPADKDKRVFPVIGFLGVLPGKDMALIMIDPKDKQLAALPLAQNLPAQGERVVAFGAPLGLSDTVTDGIVSAVRSGEELRGMLKRGEHDSYKEDLGYEVDVQWIQTSAPISPGNSGGPLVNARGEVVGINSFVSNVGQNLNFSLSAIHLREFISRAGASVQPLANLPPPRPNHRHAELGNAGKTLELWKNLNRAENELNNKLEACEKKLQQLPPIDPRNPLRGQNLRNKKVAGHFKQMGTAYKDYAARLRGFNTNDADPELIGLTVAAIAVAQKMCDACNEIANSLNLPSSQGAIGWETQLQELKEAASQIRTGREVLRVTLGQKYGQNFPTLEETAQENQAAGKKDDSGKKTKESEPTDKAAKRSEMRTWTDRTGKYRVEARLRGVEDGQAKLEKPDGSIISVPLSKLSEADRRFIEETD